LTSKKTICVTSIQKNSKDGKVSCHVGRHIVLSTSVGRSRRGNCNEQQRTQVAARLDTERNARGKKLSHTHSQGPCHRRQKSSLTGAAFASLTKAARTREAAAHPCRKAKGSSSQGMQLEQSRQAATPNESIYSANYSSLETQRLRVHTEFNRNEQQAQTAGEHKLQAIS
jgi:hypothetical protein